MSKGTLTTAQAERSAHHIMRNKLNIRNVQLIFSVIMFLTFAGLTGCRDKDSEFLEKELEQEENSQDSSEQESRQQPKADSQKSSGTQSESGDVPETIYVDVCGAVAEPVSMSFHLTAGYFRPLRKQEDISRRQQSAILTAQGVFQMDSRSMCRPGRRWTARRFHRLRTERLRLEPLLTIMSTVQAVLTVQKSVRHQEINSSRHPTAQEVLPIPGSI